MTPAGTDPLQGEALAASPCVLVLDIGTSSVRAGVYDGAGSRVSALPGAQLAYRWNTPEPGAMEIDADELLAVVARVLDVSCHQLRDAGLRVEAVGVTTFWHGLVGVDPGGRPVTPLTAWGDTRAHWAALRLRERVDAAEVHQRTGCWPHPSYPAARLLWLREERGDTFRRAARWMSIGELLGAALFGEVRTSLSMASGTGLFELRGRSWDAEVLSVVGVAAASLPPLVDTDEPYRGLRPAFRERWPELAEIPWLPAIGDGACANVGSGAVGPDRLALTVGTSAALRTVLEIEPGRIPEGLWCYRLDGRRVVLGGALSNGGNAVASLRGLLRLPPEAEWEAGLRAIQPDTHGLTVVPFLLGERGPGWETERAASVLGLTQRTPVLHLLRAWMEAVAYRLAEVAEAVEAAFGEPQVVLASGGALHASPVWVGIIADALGRPVTLPPAAEATSRGAALVALERLGAIASLALPEPGGPRFEPDPATHERYRAARRRQRRAADAVAPFHGPDVAAEARSTLP